MERAASEPTLRDDDYFVACHGVGDTGQANKTLHGPFSKDTGKFSSRIAIIIRQAEKVPGPGKYQGHEDWTLNGGSKFAKGERSYKPMHKNPDPTHYERKDIFGNPSNANKECLSNIPRITFGKMPKGKRRSFLDSSIRQGALTPGPGHYPMKTASANTLDIHQKGITKWDKEAKAGGKAKD
ncbi:unnamed protein product [Polarella glacialis]|uniref:Uncharacterized protein n=1 Tax=Polarella glacialis TaxID=89957 RepID=A0A813GHI0_POLGL|nr:unnamed protein product [Polarella glacialis]CAE8691728.1 unnamed protein product [Polarella glacialis]